MRFACVSILLTPLLAGAPTGARQAGPPTPIRDLIDAYSRGDYATVDRALARETDLDQFTTRLLDETQGIQVTRGGAYDRRLTLAAAIALEAVYQHARQSHARAIMLIVAATDLASHAPIPMPPERIWHRTALAMLEALADGSWVSQHSARAISRFPREPAFQMALAVGAELRTYPDERGGRSIAVRDRDLYNGVIELLENAHTHDAVRAEAAMRIGSVRLRGGEVERAVEHLREATSLADEPQIQYLSHLLLGRALESSGQLDDAIAAYRMATRAVPHAQTAELALAVALTRQGRSDEATALVQASIASGQRPPDPWLTYGQGDVWRLPELLDELRGALK